MEIARKNPQAVVPVLELGLTALLDKCGIDPGAIDKNCPDTQELHKFLEEWGKNGRLPPMKPTKFGVDPFKYARGQKSSKEKTRCIKKRSR